MTLLGSQVAHADSVEVKPGDTLSGIAQAHNTTVDSLANINGISNINLIIAGETIYTSPDDVKTSGVQYTQPVEVATPSVDNTVQQSVQTQAPVAQEAVVGSDVASVAAAMAARTGVPASQWEGVIMRESGGNPNAVNPSSGAYGYLQLLGHGEYPGMSVQEQIDMAVNVYNSQGPGAWTAW